ncbi:MAG: TRAP transporter permease DctM/Q, partial [Treponema sp.]|nr:TRAP transporter permease DctM/Q [Treponema sp.]
MIRKIENALALALVLLLALLPFVLKFFQGLLHLAIPDSDVALVHFVFLFSCIAGLITWREDRHLSLASFLNKLPDSAKKISEQIKTAISVCILTSLFIVSFCQLVNPTQFASNFWKMPLRFFFLFLPLCYFGIIITLVTKKNNIPGFLLGFVLGILVSAGPIAGILYYIFKLENLPFLYSLNDFWIFLSGKLFVPLILLLILFAFLGVPLFVVLAGVAYILFSKSGGYVDVLPLETYRIFTDRNIAAIPLFTIAGYILAQSSAGSRYVAVFKSLLSP